MTENRERVNKLFDRYVPMSGAAPTKGGEVIRALCRIAYRYWNDGDRIGIDYGNETTNAAARYLQANTDDTIKGLIFDMWGTGTDNKYVKNLERLEERVLIFLDARSFWIFEEKNTENMHDYSEPEDYDYLEDEEDE